MDQLEKATQVVSNNDRGVKINNNSNTCQTKSIYKNLDLSLNLIDL